MIEIVMILLYCFVNLIIITHSIYDKNKRYVKLLYNLINHKYELYCANKVK